MSLPTAGDVHVDAPLTNMSLAFIQDAESFVASKAFLTVPVQKQSDKYFTYDRGYWNRDEAQIRAPGTESAGGGYGTSTATYYAEIYAYHKDIADPVRANADAAISLENEAMEFTMMKMLIKREKDFSSNFMATSVWTTDITGVSGTPSTNEVKQWNDSSATPLNDIAAGRTVVKKSTGFDPNVLVIGREVWDELKNHTTILARINAGQTPGGPAIVTRNAVAALMELDEILIMDAIENTADEGETNSHSFIVGKVGLLLYRPRTPGLYTPAAGYNFAWTGFLGSTAEGTRMKNFRMEHLESDRVEAEMSYDLSQVSADLGYFFTSLVA